MTKKNVYNNQLSKQTLTYWLFNAASFIHLVIMWVENFPFTESVQNIQFTHFIYNITSIFFTIPAFTTFFLRYIFFGEDLYTANNLLYENGALMAIFLLSLVTNYLIVKILFLPFFQNIYKKYLKPNPLLMFCGIALIIILFAIG